MEEDDFDFHQNSKAGAAPQYIDIRSQQRNGRKCLTTIQGIPRQFSLTKILKHLKKIFNCNASVIDDPEYGPILQLQGDRRKEVAEFFVHEGIADKEHRLALAMIRDAGEAPYVSQKSLKHILVGLEKLCKAFAEQAQFIAKDSMTETELTTFANTEREKYGLPLKSSRLLEREIIDRDYEVFKLFNTDVVAIRRYIESCEANMMMLINDWLQDALDCEYLSQEGVPATVNFLSNQDILVALRKQFDDICHESERLNQYMTVNAAAIRKLISRRNKNVPEKFWSVQQYDNINLIKSPDTEDIGKAILFIKNTLNIESN